MKRKVILLMLALIIAFSATASAKPHDRDRDRDDRPSYHSVQKKKVHKWDHPSYRGEKWRKVQYHRLPFAWHEHRTKVFRPGHRVERIYDHGWSARFPGLVAYKWHDSREGFWYQGRRINDAVMFYNDSDELVSVGFMHNGAFVFIRDDDSGFENRDSFFISWWR
jgi:hypothetical protein